MAPKKVQRESPDTAKNRYFSQPSPNIDRWMRFGGLFASDGLPFGSLWFVFDSILVALARISVSF